MSRPEQVDAPRSDRPITATDRRARVATAATFVGQGLMFTVLITHLPQFTDKYAMSETTVTLVVLMVTVLAGVGSLLSEVLAHARSSRTALRSGLLLIALAAVVIAFAAEIPLFVAGFALYGLGLGAVDAAGNMQAVGVQHRYGRSILSSFHAAWSAAAIGAALYVSGGEEGDLPLTWSILIAATAVLSIAVLAGSHLLRGDDPVPAEMPGSTAAPDPGSTAAVDGVRVTRGLLLLLGLAMTCFWAVDSSISNWSTLYLRDVLDTPSSRAALGYAAYQATALVSRLGGDLAVRRIGAVSTVRAAAVVATIGLLLVVSAPGPVVAIIGFGLTGLGLPVIAPLCFSAAGAAVRSQITLTADGPEQGGAGADAAVNSVIARLNVFNYLGSLCGAVLVGGVAVVADLRIGFLVAVLLAASVFGLARAFAPAESGRKEPETKLTWL